MRNLKFKIKAQQITRDPTCDFTKIVAGSKGYLKAVFEFSSEWSGCKKAAGFWCLGKELAMAVIDNECMIPEEALLWENFQVAVVGEREGYRITTNKISIEQEKGGHNGNN